MNEETEINENIDAADIESEAPAFEMPTKETFSFFEVLAERTYPTDKVTVFLDEQAAYDAHKLALEMDSAKNPTNEDIEEYTERIEALRYRINQSQYTFHLRGISDDHYADAKAVVDGRFKPKQKHRKRADGSLEEFLTPDDQMAYLRFLSALMISLHVEQIVDPQGRINTAPSADEIAYFVDKAPSAATEALNAAVQALRVSSSEYERALDEGFFQKP